MHSETVSSNIRSGTPKETTAKAAWSIDTPEYLLLLVIAFIIWTFGFIELLNTTTTDPDILGLYSLPIFILLIGSSLGFIVLGILFTRPHASGWLTGSAAYVQNRPLLAIGTLTTIVAISWFLITLTEYSFRGANIIAHLPVSRFMIVMLLAISAGVILWGGWSQTPVIPRWRKVISLFIGVVIGLEVIIQAFAYYGLLPGTQHVQGLFVPYGRVYQNQEGFANSHTNNYGWYYPDFKLRKDTHKILLLGDSFIEALQISPEQHLGVHLETLINDQAPEGKKVEVLAMGMPGFGPGLYLSETRITGAIQAFEPDEVIVFFHVGSDFHTATIPSDNDIVFELNSDGQIELHPESVNPIHNQKHYILPGYEFVVDPLATLQSQYLSTKFLSQVLAKETVFDINAIDAMDIPGFSGQVTDKTVVKANFTDIKQTRTNDTFGKNNHLFEKTWSDEAEKAFIITSQVLSQAQAQLGEADIPLHIVTIPAFPKAFFEQNEGASWPTKIGTYDLLGPEKALAQFAAEEKIPFLATGDYLKTIGADVETIQSYYFFEGVGHFTPEGHRFFAEAVYACLYDEQAMTSCSVN
ncbi:MAG: SGNH/GDSL hydrolase family protein [Chloroflexota bacterium]